MDRREFPALLSLIQNVTVASPVQAEIYRVFDIIEDRDAAIDELTEKVRGLEEDITDLRAFAVETLAQLHSLQTESEKDT